MTGEAKSQRQSILKNLMLKYDEPFKTWEIETMSRGELNRKIKQIHRRYDDIST